MDQLLHVEGQTDNKNEAHIKKKHKEKWNVETESELGGGGRCTELGERGDDLIAGWGVTNSHLVVPTLSYFKFMQTVKLPFIRKASSIRTNSGTINLNFSTELLIV